MYQTIRYEKNGSIGIATINRPEALNALNSTVISELEISDIVTSWLVSIARTSVQSPRSVKRTSQRINW